MAVINLKQIDQQTLTLTIKSLSPMIQHKWSEKAKEMMRQKHAGKKTKTREVRVPEQESIDATYFTDEGTYGFPAGALKAALITAAHKDIGIEKTLVRKSLFVQCYDSGNVIEMITDEPIMREDMVRVGAGSADLRYRPHFKQWSAIVSIDYDAEMLTKDDIINLVNRAGFGVGLCEMRPEKGKEFGRFEVDMAHVVANAAKAA